MKQTQLPQIQQQQCTKHFQLVFVFTFLLILLGLERHSRAVLGCVDYGFIKRRKRGAPKLIQGGASSINVWGNTRKKQPTTLTNIQF